jgi:hypothetical protein
MGPVPHFRQSMPLGGSFERDLEDQSPDPDDDVQDEDSSTSDQSPGSSFVRHEVGDEPNEDTADDGSQTGKQGREGSSSTVEVVCGDGALVRVEVVGREEHRASESVCVIGTVGWV